MIDDSLTAHPPTANVGIQINRIKTKASPLDIAFEDIKLLSLVLCYSNTANIQLQRGQADRRFMPLWRGLFCACCCRRSLGGNLNSKQATGGCTPFYFYEK